jgi:NAD/NADP transhydrogenase alpha subunit
VQSGAGHGAFIPDADYQTAGATLAASAAELYASAELLLKVRRPEPSEAPLATPGAAPQSAGVVLRRSPSLLVESIEIGKTKGQTEAIRTFRERIGASK